MREIYNDNFSKEIYDIVFHNPEIKNILEIGSGTGEGSTFSFVSAIKDSERQDISRLFCIELMKDNFDSIVNLYKDDKFVIPVNKPSVKISESLKKQEISDFYNNVKTNLNQYSLDRVLSWKEQEDSIVSEMGLQEVSGIDEIKKMYKIKKFDFVLIDGSPFTGLSEFQKIVGATWIALDDINDIKCLEVHNKLLNDLRYELVVQDWNLRNGFSIFKLKGK